jgi:hypothetical protein
MNERIRELLNEACRYAYEQNPGENSYGRPVDENKYNQDRDTKFAQLIVEEVYDYILNATFDDEPWPSRKDVKQYFGVGE